MSLRAEVAQALALIDAGDELAALETLRGLLADVDAADAEPTLPCPCCERTFRTREALADHLQIDHDEPRGGQTR